MVSGFCHHFSQSTHDTLDWLGKFLPSVYQGLGAVTTLVSAHGFYNLATILVVLRQGLQMLVEMLHHLIFGRFDET